MDRDRKYYAKLMLAGEYAVTAGGEALTVPLRMFSASLKHRDKAADPDQATASVSSLQKLYAYLAALPQTNFSARLNLSEFDDMMKQNYYIESSIPEEYGVGSSAAVSALVYDQFFEDQNNLSLQQQKDDLAMIESFFHGKSSGADALSSYKDQPIHFTENGPELISNTHPLKHPSGYRFFLLNSKTKLKTAPLVEYFNLQMKEQDFRDMVMNDLLPLNSKFIKSLLHRSDSDLALIFRAVSDLQWQYFRKMIPETVEDAWIHGQVSNLSYLKLNGSGGGYVLGIAHQDSMSAIHEQIPDFDITWL